MKCHYIYKLLFGVFATLLFGVGSIGAQNIKPALNGRVVDESDSALPGVGTVTSAERNDLSHTGQPPAQSPY